MSDRKVAALIARLMISGAVVGGILAARLTLSRSVEILIAAVVVGVIILALASPLLGIKVSKQAVLRDAPLAVLGMLAGIFGVGLYRYILK
jgi:hypothetical protein